MKKFIANQRLVWIVLLFASVSHAQVFVATTGSDHNTGTKEKPYASLHMALRHVRELRRLNDTAADHPLHIYLQPGTYRLDETVFIRPEDAGTAQSPTIIETVGGAPAVLSGGVRITGWKKLSAPNTLLPAISRGKVWVADAPLVGGNLLDFRQLWINEQKATRAKTPNGDSMYRIYSWNRQTGDSWTPSSGIKLVKKVEGVEMFVHQWWAIANLRIKNAFVKGDSARLSFYEPENRIQKEHPWPSPWISSATGNSAYHLINSPEFLDSPGEWYLDKLNRKVYYWPTAGEDLTTAMVVAPRLETLVKVEGTADHPVSHIYFRNVSFQHASWLRPAQQGNVPHQAGMPMTDAYKLRPAGTPDKKTLENQAWIVRPKAAVEINYADNIVIEHCSFRHTASTALDHHKGIHDNLVAGNLFEDIGGTAILAGVFADEAMEIHLPYDPQDERDICSGMTITNNLVVNATNEDWSCVGIGAGFVRNISVDHNEIADVGYTGISMGWGWTPSVNAMRNNRITANYIHHYGKHNYDCAGIYTLSAQPGTVISQNVIDSIYKAPYAHLPSHWFYLYTDEGSSYITVKDNWTPSQKYLQNANGPGNEWINNGPQVSAAIKMAAGLQDGYSYLAAYRPQHLDTIPINTEHRELIEIVLQEGQSLAIDSLRKLLRDNKLDPSVVFQWQNHYVVFDKMKDIGALQSKIEKLLPGALVKPYYNLVYEFNRGSCSDTTTAREWKDYLLTAELVPDPKKQQEYLEYHRTQFRKWPEVAQGFCNADFQQLLVFKNGSQLMLVISVPSGKTLDELNPKTTLNNPRVDDWNKIMAQYQRGIQGTKPGETWVFLEPLTPKGE